MASMTYSELVQMVASIGLPSAYDHFVEGESPDPPFVVFLLPSDNNFKADGGVYVDIVNATIELYTDSKQPGIEYAIQEVLRANDIVWRKGEVWIPAERLYEVTYTFGLLLEPEDYTDATSSDSGTEGTESDTTGNEAEPEGDTNGD